MEKIIYSGQIERTRIIDPPLFIIGYWRCGTTLLHELLALDKRHTAPTTYECFLPNHFVLTERFAVPSFNFILPPKRPMDNVALGFERPYEDEYAFCNMNQPSLYHTIAFPEQAQHIEHISLDNVSRRELERWKRAFLYFLKRITFLRPMRLVVKSPTHTCRISVLLELFPEARFVHIVRNPFNVLPSMLHTLNTMFSIFALKRPRFEVAKEYAFYLFTHLYEKLDQTICLVDPFRFYELRYEDLIRDPIGQMQALYENLGLGEFELILPLLKKYLENSSDYQPNRFYMSPELRAEIRHRCGWVIRKYGYSE
jgi:hypothetical protein